VTIPRVLIRVRIVGNQIKYYLLVTPHQGVFGLLVRIWASFSLKPDEKDAGIPGVQRAPDISRQFLPVFQVVKILKKTVFFSQQQKLKCM
jgi:hypothetical protein